MSSQSDISDQASFHSPVSPSFLPPIILPSPSLASTSLRRSSSHPVLSPPSLPSPSSLDLAEGQVLPHQRVSAFHMKLAIASLTILLSVTLVVIILFCVGHFKVSSLQMVIFNYFNG